MSESNKQTRGTCIAGGMRFPVQRTYFSGLVVAVLLIALLPARAEEPEDQYLRIYNLIEQADSLSTKGEPGPALAKYRQAQTALLNLRRTYRSWNEKLVSFRMDYVEEKVASLSAKSSPSAPPATNAAPLAPGQARVIEAGGEPRKVLRLHPKAGDKQTLVMSLKMAIDIKMGDMATPAMKMPAMKMTMDATVKSVSADGDIDYEMMMGDASVADDPEVMPQVAEAMKSAFANFKGMTGTGTVSSRGMNKGAEIQMPPDASPQAVQAIEQMKESFSRFSAPLPEEPVGAGAKWEVKMPLKSQGMMIEQTATYQLVSIDGERLTTKSTMTQSATNQKIENPAMPGVKVDVNKMIGNGTNDVTIDLAKLLPEKGNGGLHSELSMEMNMGGKKQPLEMKMNLNFHLEGK
jgi:hypothetical protein